MMLKLEKLIELRNKINIAIEVLKQFEKPSNESDKKNSILKETKKHWTQTPEGRKRMSKIMKERKAKERNER